MMRAIHPLFFCLVLLPQPLAAALPVGTQAPDFTTVGALKGKVYKLHLREQLKNGPLVLYFFPQAFTPGCTLEAHAFSAAANEFKKAGARVVGMSADDLSTLKKFSVEGCRNAFPVARATPDLIKAYDVALKQKRALTDRTSYVIDRSGKIVFVHSDLKWGEHVSKTLAAVKGLKR